MRIFQMNLLNYNTNTQYPANGNRTQKQALLRNEMNAYRAALPGNFTIAGFTEAFAANGAVAANVENALNDFGDQLAIPTAAGRRHVAVIRCGCSALQQSNEVVAIVLDGNAVVNKYGVLYFTNNNPIQWIDLPVTGHINAGGSYTAYLNQIPGIPDYRFIVYVDYTIGGNNYVVGFIHNRQPRQAETVVVMGGIRNLLSAQAPVNLTLCGGDFNADSLAIGAGGIGVHFPANGHHPLWYYSPGDTTVRNPLDYWMSFPQLMDPAGIGTAKSDRTPNPPIPANTGSDHRGTGINIA